MKNKNLIDSFNNAINGIIHTFRHERNMKIHIVAALAVMILSLFFKLSRIEFLILFFAVALVIICELFNTAIEALVDIMTEEYHPKAKIAKDVAAGAVFVSAFFSLIVAYLLFFERIGTHLDIGIRRLEKSRIHVTLIAAVITIIIVLIFKALFKKGTPFYGGMPSGHSAMSSSIVTSIALLTEDINIVILAILLALLVIQSRLEAKIHSVVELLAGAVLGFLITILLFKLF